MPPDALPPNSQSPTPTPLYPVELKQPHPLDPSLPLPSPHDKETIPPSPPSPPFTSPSTPSISGKPLPLSLSRTSSAANTPRLLTTSGRSVHFDYSDAGTPSIPVPPLTRIPSFLTLSPSIPPPPSPYQVYIALVLAQLFWSGFHVLGKWTFSFLSPFVLPTFRSIGVIPIFALYAYRQNPRFYVLTPRQHGLMVIEALLGNTIAQQCFNYGVQLSSAALAGMCQPSIPVMTTILAIVLKREGVSTVKVVGISVAIVGSLLMVLGAGGGGSDDTADSNFPLGALLFLTQCACTSVYIIVQKPMFAQGMEVRAFTFYLFLYGGVGHVLFGAFFLPSVQWSTLPLTLIPVLLYTIVVATFAAFSLFVFATNNLPASVSSLGITLQSFFSPLLGAIFLGEVVTWVDVIGGIAIVVGIVVVVWAKGREGKQQQMEEKTLGGQEETGGGENAQREEEVEGEEGFTSEDSDDEGEDDGVDLDESDEGEEEGDIEMGYVGHIQHNQRLTTSLT